MIKKNEEYFVLDCSVTMSWCFEDESSQYTDDILMLFSEKKAVVPTIWPLEVSNVLLMAERRKRITFLQATEFIDALSILPIEVDPTTTARATGHILQLAKSANLTVYDAAYFEIALRENIAIATLDKALIKAAKKMKVKLL